MKTLDKIQLVVAILTLITLSLGLYKWYKESKTEHLDIQNKLLDISLKSKQLNESKT